MAGTWLINLESCSININATPSYLNGKIVNSPKLWWKYLIPSPWLNQHYLCVETFNYSTFKHNLVVNKCFLSTHISITRCMLHWVIYCYEKGYLLFCDEKSFTWHPIYCSVIFGCFIYYSSVFVCFWLYASIYVDECIYI